MKTPPFSNRKRLATALLGSILVAVFLMLSQSERHFSPVIDEMANIPGGHNFLSTGRYTDATHPPLLRYLMAIPLYLMGSDPLVGDESGNFRWSEYGKLYLFQNKISWQQTLTGTRTVIILLSLLLLAFVYRWTRTLWGRTAAFSALLFFAFEPNFLAHAQLATLDLGLSLAFFFAVYALWVFLKNPGWPQFLLLQLATGIAFMTKFSAISLFLSAAICLFIFRKKYDLRLNRFWFTPFFMLFIMWGSYLFQMKSGSEDPQVTRSRGNIKTEAELDKLAGSLGTTREHLLSIKVPAYDFWKGFGMQTFHAMFQDLWRKKEAFQYLDGEYADRGWRTYFFWTFLYKSTIPTVILLLVTGFFWAKRQIPTPRSPDPTATCLMISPLVLFILCSLGTINIGHRYILPVYPFLAMGVGYLAARTNGWAKKAVFALILVHIGSSAAVWPHHLAYFNELSRGRFHLADSNIDWGQDLIFLKKDLASPTVAGANVCGDIFGLAKPADLGISLPAIPKNWPDSLPTGINTVYFSVNNYLNRSAVNPEGPHPWLCKMQPTRTVGRSILVFEIKK